MLSESYVNYVRTCIVKSEVLGQLSSVSNIADSDWKSGQIDDSKGFQRSNTDHSEWDLGPQIADWASLLAGLTIAIGWSP